jgi:ADP-L-glycero-D-manno-heptose 6-epimerase
MIVLTGAGGFVGSVVLGYLNKQGIDDIVIFDDLPINDQYKNLINKRFISLHSTDEMFESLEDVKCVIHIGANSSTLEKDWSSIYKTNILSTRAWNRFCTENQIPFIFTSSAAIYGNGEGPLNHYAFSKHLSENEINGVVLRLFNVYGPNEYHKGRMASTIYHWYKQLQSDTNLRIFEKSRNYRRDFIWVEDIAKTVYYFINNYRPGVYELGTGVSYDFETIADILLKTHGRGGKTEIIMPDDLRSQYQTDTRANVSTLVQAGAPVHEFLNPYQGIPEYHRYLINDRYY